MTNYSEQMQKLFAQYEASVCEGPASLRDVGRWAIDNKLWAARDEDILSQFADDMARALREEYRTDRSGRRYRAKHAVRTSRGGKQLSFWADIDRAPRSHLERAFAQRRRQIVGDCHQLRLDVDHFNDTRPDEQPIQLVLDFTEDIEEMLWAEGVSDAA